MTGPLEAGPARGAFSRDGRSRLPQATPAEAQPHCPTASGSTLLKGPGHPTLKVTAMSSRPQMQSMTCSILSPEGSQPGEALALDTEAPSFSPAAAPGASPPPASMAPDGPGHFGWFDCHPLLGLQEPLYIFLHTPSHGAGGHPSLSHTQVHTRAQAHGTHAQQMPDVRDRGHTCSVIRSKGSSQQTCPDGPLSFKREGRQSEPSLTHLWQSPPLSTRDSGLSCHHSPKGSMSCSSPRPLRPSSGALQLRDNTQPHPRGRLWLQKF